MFIEPAWANYALGFLLWSLIPKQAGLPSMHTMGYLGGWGILSVNYPKIRQTYKTNCRIFGYSAPPPPVTRYVRVSEPSLGGDQGP